MLSRLVNLLRAGPIDVQYQGAVVPLLSSGQRHRARRPVQSRLQFEELDFLRAHTPVGGVFVDVGANVGTYAMVLARHVGASGKVIAIEPHPVTHARLASTALRPAIAQVRLLPRLPVRATAS